MNNYDLNKMMSLTDISNNHYTDKSFRIPYGHNYTPFYDMILKDKRIDLKNMLEIGVFEGSSMKMWLDYFINSMIYGWDIINTEHLNGNRIKTFIVDQGKKDMINNFFLNNPIKFDFVIDDGSHIWSDQIISLFNIFPHLNDGGIYIIEDMWTDVFDGFLKIMIKQNYINDIDNKIISLINKDQIQYLIDNLLCVQKNNVIFSSGDDKSDHIFYTFYKK